MEDLGDQAWVVSLEQDEEGEEDRAGEGSASAIGQRLFPFALLPTAPPGITSGPS